FQLGVDQKLLSRTFLVLEAQLLQSAGARRIGVYDYFPNPSPFFPFSAGPSATGTRQSLDFEEKSFAATLNQLVSDEWSLGTRYRISNAELETDLPQVPRSADPAAHLDERATLHELNLFAIYQNPAGFFGQVESIWRAQSNRGSDRLLSGDDFWQFNVFAGYRLPGRRAEFTVGVLNLADQNYRLNPLNLANDLPHRRTLFTSLKFSF
ncbi:MAG TPA: hypothetical protein VEO53_02855, partial [Candidatus Binatia bacterium]|nr:hypothetical protein [Candidatus Binatia bacterium]